LASLRGELGVAEDDFMLLNVGSAFRTKGVDRAIQALGSLPGDLAKRTKLVVVGSDKPDSFKNLARKLGIGGSVIFTGGRSDVADFYYAADLLIHPARSENTGTTLLEAMVCGLPVLATANCGYAHHVSDADAGLICPDPFVPNELNGLLARAIQSQKRDTWKENALQYCQTTDLYSMVDQAVNLIEQRALSNCGSRP